MNPTGNKVTPLPPVQRQYQPPAGEKNYRFLFRRSRNALIHFRSDTGEYTKF